VYWAVGKTLYAFSLTPAAIPVVTASAGAAPAVVRSVKGGVYRADQAEAGKALYLKSCATGCHNENLSGAGPTPSLAGPDFLGRWSGLSVGELFKRVRTTMPKAKPGSLADDDYLSIIAYLLSANGFKPGLLPIANDSTELGKTVIAGAAPDDGSQ
jgi:mono/diheme cytochrome c family protein